MTTKLSVGETYKGVMTKMFTNISYLEIFNTDYNDKITVLADTETPLGSHNDNAMLFLDFKNPRRTFEYYGITTLNIRTSKYKTNMNIKEFTNNKKTPRLSLRGYARVSIGLGKLKNVMDILSVIKKQYFYAEGIYNKKKIWFIIEFDNKPSDLSYRGFREILFESIIPIEKIYDKNCTNIYRVKMTDKKLFNKIAKLSYDITDDVECTRETKVIRFDDNYLVHLLRNNIVVEGEPVVSKDGFYLIKKVMKNDNR